jgi:hypothetical protein
MARPVRRIFGANEGRVVENAVRDDARSEPVVVNGAVTTPEGVANGASSRAKAATE